MIEYSFQPLLPMTVEEVSVLGNPEVDWAQLVQRLNVGILDPICPRYHAAAREFNKRKPVRGPGRPRSRASAEEQAARARDGAPVQVSGPEDLVKLGPEARPARTGRSPKPFHSMVLAFLLTSSDDSPCAPEHVHRMLHGNPAFAARCGFEYPAKCRGRRSRRRDIPDIRTVCRFDQVMAVHGLWGEVCSTIVKHNLVTGVIARSDAFVADTTHMEANSSSRTVELPLKAAPALSKQRRVVSERAKDQRKAATKRKIRIPRLTKHCRHRGHDTCNCKWSSGDDGAGVVVKAATKKYWAHKITILGFAGTTLPLDVAVVSCASAHDSTTLEPSLERLWRLMPEAFLNVQFTIADPAYDDAPGRARIRERFNLDLLTKINPRARKESPLPGHETQFTLNPQGQPVCLRKLPMALVSRDVTNERFNYRGPTDENGVVLCRECPHAAACGLKGERRTVSIPRELTPQIDWLHPQHLPSERTRYRLRTAVERQIERLKGPLERNRLACRGRVRVQGFLDLRLAALHALIAEP